MHDTSTKDGNLNNEFIKNESTNFFHINSSEQRRVGYVLVFVAIKDNTNVSLPNFDLKSGY